MQTVQRAIKELIPAMKNQFVFELLLRTKNYKRKENQNEIRNFLSFVVLVRQFHWC